MKKMMTRTTMSGETRWLVHRIMLGCGIYNAVLILLSLVLFPGWSVAAGLLMGMLAGFGMIWHMAYTMEQVAGGKEETVIRRNVMAWAMVRKVVFGALFLAILFWFSDYINPLALVVGALGLKAGIYMTALGRKLKKESPI